MPRKTSLPLIVILMTLSIVASADTVTLLPGGSPATGTGITIPYLNTGGTPAANLTISLGADGRTLTINFQNITASDYGIYQFDLVFYEADPGNFTTSFSNFSSGDVWRQIYTGGNAVGFGYGFGINQYSPGLINSGTLRPDSPNVVGPGQGGTIVLTFATPVTTLILDAEFGVIQRPPSSGDWVLGGGGVDLRGGVEPVPEPATLALLGTGLAAMVGIRRRRKS